VLLVTGTGGRRRCRCDGQGQGRDQEGPAHIPYTRAARREVPPARRRAPPAPSAAQILGGLRVGGKERLDGEL
jgi:hypothetical protein